MAYQVLARKWRPKTFADLVGQEHVVKALRNALDEGRLHHAYLLTGTRGVGKTTIARILAKSLNCEQADHGEPCGVCSSCTQIDAGRYVDLLEIDAASNTGIDNIREVLENAQYAPTAGKYKVYIIDEVHMLSKSAFNAMLKTLEEPPEHVKFILATTDPHKVPVTVLSRCLQFVLRNMTTQQVAEHLAHVLDSEEIPYEPAALQLLGRAAAGSMRDALSLLDQAIAMGSGNVAERDVRQMIGAVDKQYLYELLQGIVAQDGEALLEKAQEMAARAIGFDSALSELAMLLQRLALIQAVPAALAGDDPERDTLLALSRALSGEQIQLYYQCAIHGKQDLSLAPDEYAGFVMTLLRMLAFAPLAAKAHDAQSVIEHTQLHDAETTVLEKKPQATTPLQHEAVDVRTGESEIPAGAAPSSLTTAMDGNLLKQFAAAKPEQADSVALNPVSGQMNDVPPWETQAHDSVSIQTASMQAIAADRPSEAEMPPSPVQSLKRWSEVVETQLHEGDAVELADAAVSAEGDDLPLVEYEEIPSDDEMIDDVFPSPEYTPSFSEEREEVDAEEADEGDEDEPQFAPLPEFKPENWPQLVQRFAKQFGAAQMLAQHAAWIGYDESRGLMMLSLTEEARKTTNKERLDKIQTSLAEAYGLPLMLQTEPWREDAGWETPAMRHKRLQREGRQQAQDALEADPTARKIVQLFEGQWLPDSLELLAKP